jgi:hypothetical protein
MVRRRQGTDRYRTARNSRAGGGGLKWSTAVWTREQRR